MTSKKAIWIKDQKLLDRFNHFKIDNGKNSDVSLGKLLDYWGEGHKSAVKEEIAMM